MYALIIGNSDGIGLSVSEALLSQGWRVVGVSKSPSSIQNLSYTHHVMDVRRKEYIRMLQGILKTSGPPDLCVYCAGIGEILDISRMMPEISIFEVNLLGVVKTAAIVVPEMAGNGHGHFVGLSSVADDMLSPEAPSYHASKAGMSNYLEGLGLALRGKGIYVTNIRFGFVNTKMAKGDVKPFMMSVERATQHVMRCIRKRPVRYSAPRLVIPLVKFRR